MTVDSSDDDLHPLPDPPAAVRTSATVGTRDDSPSAPVVIPSVLIPSVLVPSVVLSSVVVGDDGRARCRWGATDAEYRRYHDEEWGFPLHGDRPLFEKLCLEGFQAGLSWITILRRRPRFRSVFSDFDIPTVANLGADDVDRLMLDEGIIRHRGKIEATISNARVTLDLVGDAPGAFDELMWSFAPGHDRPRRGGDERDQNTPVRQRPATLAEIPAITPESTAMSRELRTKGYRFVGPTTMYALMQSSGMVDDHVTGCWRAG